MNSPDIDFSQAGVLGNRLLQQLNELRAVDPIFFSEPQNAWIVTGHEEVAEGFSGTLPLSSHRHEFVARFFPDAQERSRRIGYLMDVLPTWVVFSDAPQHPRLRKLMVKAFNRQMAERYRPFVRGVVRETLDAVAGKPVVDVVRELALPVPALTILQLLGLPRERFGQANEWATLSTESIGGYAGVETLERLDRGYRELGALLQAEVDKRRVNPGDDFVSTLVAAEVDGDRLSDIEIVGQLILVLLAGQESTTSTIALTLAALSREPEARAYIRANPDRIVDAVMELMRYVAMSMSMGRFVSQDFEWRGHQLKKGQLVQLMIAGANRDPRVFPEPEKIDFGRPQDANMTFAPGMHHCIGHLFAKMEVTEFLAEFLNRYEHFELVDPEIRFTRSISFRGPVGMRMRLNPRQHAMQSLQ